MRKIILAAVLALALLTGCSTGHPLHCRYGIAHGAAGPQCSAPGR